MGGRLLCTPLGQDNYWYRHHPLLAEFLRQRSAARHGTEVAELHRRAARWFARRSSATAMARALQLGPCANAGPRDCGDVDPRERGILELIAEGHSNKEIARSLDIAPETVKSHVKNIFDKLSVEKRAQAIARAQSLGLLRTV